MTQIMTFFQSVCATAYTAYLTQTIERICYCYSILRHKQTTTNHSSYLSTAAKLIWCQWSLGTPAWSHYIAVFSGTFKETKLQIQGSIFV